VNDVALSSAPLIFTRCIGPVRISWLERLAAFAVALTCLTVLIIGAWLRPDPSGMGTHQQLGLPACVWLRLYGIPCPACGFTTAFSYYSHGNWIASLFVQPMGFVLAMLAAMMAWVGFYIAATGRPVHRLVANYWTQWTVIWLLGMFLAAWAYKIVLTLTHHDGWRGF
jgi:Protein of unknown function (DUF2752)